MRSWRQRLGGGLRPWCRRWPGRSRRPARATVPSDDERADDEPDEQADEEEQRLSVSTLLDAALVAVVGAAEDVVWHAYSSGLLGAYFSTSAFRCLG